MNRYRKKQVEVASNLRLEFVIFAAATVAVLTASILGIPAVALASAWGVWAGYCLKTWVEFQAGRGPA